MNHAGVSSVDDSGVLRQDSYGEDGIYFDHRGDCRDSALHRTCAGRWRGVVLLGFDADGKRIRRKVSGKTKAEVKDKLKALHSELDAGLRTAQGYTVEKAVADWLDEGLPRRTAKTVEANRDSPLCCAPGRTGTPKPGRSRARRSARALPPLPRRRHQRDGAGASSRAAGLVSRPSASPAPPLHGPLAIRDKHISIRSHIDTCAYRYCRVSFRL